MVHVPGCIYERCTTYEYEIRIPEREQERENIRNLSRIITITIPQTAQHQYKQFIYCIYIYITPYISIQEVTHFNNEHEFQYLWQIKVNSVFNEGLILSSSGTTEGSAKARRSCIVCREIEGEYCPARQAVSYCESFFQEGM